MLIWLLEDDESVSRALDWPRGPGSLRDPAESPCPVWLDGLTRQEKEVMRLVGQGMRLLQWAALIALVGYGLRLLSIYILGEGAYIFAGAPLHSIAVMCILGFALLSNIAFLRMVLEAFELDRHLTRDALTASQSAASRYALETPQASIEAFGSVISHELNQPLTAMQLNLEHLGGARFVMVFPSLHQNT